MKRIKILAVLLTISILSGCAGQNVQSDSPSGSDIAYEESTISEETKEEIIQLLYDYGDFNSNYIYCGYDSYASTNLNRSKFVTVEKTIVGGANDGDTYEQYYYKVTGDGITTEAGLYEAMLGLCTEKHINEELSPTLDNIYQFSDGDLYLTDVGVGGLIGYSSLSIDNIGKTDDDTLLLSFTAHGDEELETEDSNFTVTIKITEQGMRIDECDIFAQSFLVHFKTIE